MASHENWHRLSTAISRVIDRGWDGEPMHMETHDPIGKMRLLSWIVVVMLGTASTAHSGARRMDFVVILKRIGCLGTCPEYTVEISGNGTVRYEGFLYVRTEGVRKRRIALSAVQKLIQMLRDEDFFHWEEKTYVCVDFPETDITVTLNSQKKKVIEGCESPGKVLDLADEIDRISGAKTWVGRVKEP
jgi:hypothetical protein